MGRGWAPVSMVNNAERLDPYGDDEHSAVLRAARAQRVLRALDEGEAWRRRRDSALVVARLEVFEQADPTAHRAAWRDHGVSCLDEVWRQRWRERDRTPGWIEARWHGDGDPLGVAADWITVEDQTGVADTGAVTLYEHVSVWDRRALATVTIRHDLGTDLDDEVERVVTQVRRRLADLDVATR